MTHGLEKSGLGHATALKHSKASIKRLHPGDREFLEHAIEQYFDLHESREARLGPLTFLGNWIVVPSSQADLAVWGPVYEATNGDREVRRLRYGNAKRDDTVWADIAAFVTARTSGQFEANKIYVVEVGLADGVEQIVVNGEDVTSINNRFNSRGQAAVDSMLAGGPPLPGGDCSSCKAYNACNALIPTPGALQQTQKAAWTRSVSARDLIAYETCPAQWHMEAEHLPADRQGTEAQLRGIAVHAWLRRAHERHVPCQMSDLVAPDSDHLGLAEGVIDRADYRVAYPYLRHHINNCPLTDPAVQVAAIEETQYCLDSTSDVVVAIKPDMILTRGDTLILREVKTTQQQLPADADAARDIYLAVSLSLSVMESGLLNRFRSNHRKVHLEIITLLGSRVYEYDLSDKLLMKMVRSKIRNAASAWARDTTWDTRPGQHCTWCPVRRWCPDRDTYTTAGPSGSLDRQSGNGDIPPF